MITTRLFLALWLPFLLLGGPARADHGGPLASAPMSPLVTALLAGGLAFVTVLLLGLIWRLMTGSRRDTE
jgi:uncharacterized membrane protein